VAEKEPAAHGVHGDVAFVVDPGGQGGAVLSVHVSASPESRVK
jgi:hypothetical protein